MRKQAGKGEVTFFRWRGELGPGARERPGSLQLPAPPKAVESTAVPVVDSELLGKQHECEEISG